MAIKRSDIATKVIPKFKAEIISAVKQNNPSKLQEVLQRICGVIVLRDVPLDSDFINAIKQNKLDTFGSYEVRSAGRAYFIDFVGQTSQQKEVTTSCGRKVTINYVICNEPYDSQVINEYSDILDVNVKKQLAITITNEEFRKIACGQNAYNDLMDLVRSKVVEATYNLIYNEVDCRLNDPMSYKQVKEIPYCCDLCDGQNFMSALEEFALTLQRNTADYNLAGRDYDLPINRMWLLKSFKLNSRINNLLSRAFNNNLVNLNQQFGQTWAIDIKNYDGIILDQQAIQVHEVFNEVYWEYSPKRRAQCGIVNYDARIKILTTHVAVPFKLIKIDCAEKEQADNITDKIESITKTYQVTDQTDAETKIKADIDALKPADSKLTFTYRFSNFVAPAGTVLGSIDVAVDIVNENGTVIETANNTMKLTTTTPATLASVVKNLDMGTFPTRPDASTLEAQMATLNANYVKGNATISAITDTGATATGINIYTGTVALTFKVVPALSTVITNPDLGPIGYSGDNPTPEEITAGIVSLYPVLASANFAYTGITATNANVTDTSGAYSGAVAIRYRKA